MPKTAFQHFNEDIERAKKLVDHADSMPQMTSTDKLIRSDILRSGWMFAAGALDAYLCDAYTWVVGGTLIAKDREPSHALPARFLKTLMGISLPIASYLGNYQSRDRWRFRMAARRMMDDRNMLNLGAVESSFNPFMPQGHKFYHNVIINWVSSAKEKYRIFGVSTTTFKSLSHQQKTANRDDYIKAMRERFDDVIFQRRHDCIHNCDRPKIAPQALTRPGTVRNVIGDVQFFTENLNVHIETHFPVFLRGIGYSPTTVQAATN